MNFRICYFVLKIFIFTAESKFYFSTNTAYEYVANFEDKEIFPHYIKPIYISYTGRHGARFPSDKDIKAMDEIQKLLQEKTYFGEYIPLIPFNLDVKLDLQLVPNGFTQLYGIGERFRKRFPTLLHANFYTPHDFFFEATNTSRTIQSMISLSNGIYNISSKSIALPNYSIRDLMTDKKYRYYYLCQSYTAQQKCQEHYPYVETEFGQSPYMQKVVQKVSENLKIPYEELSLKDVITIYLICAYSLAMNVGKINEGMCKLFDRESFYTMDYYHDIKHFYRRSNVYDLNLQIACNLFKDTYESIVRNLEKCEDPSFDYQPTGNFGFAHAESLLPLIGSFGFFDSKQNIVKTQNENLLLNTFNFQKLNRTRRFKAGLYTPMGGNLAFVVGCHESLKKGVILTFINENPVSLPCCREDGRLENNQKISTCSKEKFIQCFETRAKTCNFDEICQQNIICQNNLHKRII